MHSCYAYVDALYAVHTLAAIINTPRGTQTNDRSGISLLHAKKLGSENRNSILLYIIQASTQTHKDPVQTSDYINKILKGDADSQAGHIPAPILNSNPWLPVT